MIPEARNMSYERVSEVYNSVDSIAERSRHPFGILLGPSGVGKSTIIRDMVGAWPDKYVYI
ncbi:MAG: hypothetical protein WCL07_04625, partial [bacterium]